MLSTIHKGIEFLMVTRNTKVNKQHQRVYMGGVDLFDQYVSSYRVLGRTRKF